MKSFFAAVTFAVLVLQPAFGSVEAIPTWVQPLRPKARFDLVPFERTRPVLFGDILFVADLQGRVVAWKRSNASILWEAQMPTGVSGALAYGRRSSKVVVGDRQGNLVAFNARDGSEAWRFKVAGEWQSPAVFVRDSEHRHLVVVIASTGDLYALGEDDGKEVWHYARRSDEKMSIFGMGGPATYGDTEIFQGFTDGSVVALSADKGRVLWERSIRSRERFYDVDMAPLVNEKRVIAATYDGRVACLDRVTGNTQWVFPVGSNGGFVVDGGRVYFGGINHHFYALDLNNGQPIWTTPYEGGIATTPLLLKGALVFPTSSDPTYLVDPNTGKILNQLSLGAGTGAAAVGSSEDGWFYEQSNYGNLFAFQLKS